ncbi:neck protein [Nitrososphaeria virus YSH_1032793]|uniref:Neck protein n=1 Tax=Nitrososphaeria virus YSH_1032793 TaxID=3071320 RepID=A0A976YF25_9CAUD|nr:neck protein [Yangshan Harbor Nitrososphaeria virus]UVF62232.1 neck protein [Nitrososphaeria virus YSH_1032793]
MSAINRPSGFTWEKTNKNKIFLQLDEVSKKNDNFVSDCLDALLGKFIIELDKRIPRDTGEYAHSWYAEREKLTILFKTELTLLATWLEISGVKAHKIEPLDPTGFLMWFDKSGLQHFAKSVWHKGYPPRPHISPAKRETRREAKWIVLAVAKKHFTFMQKTIQGSRDVPLEHYINVGRNGRLS